ncbi:MAG: cyclic nucleotide-binding domain-containing protein [Chthoniobacterales bacterium]|nr:cyclic nucleotide-binding domain-containing protein [Chthoniobacterales bacterium]
MVKHRAFFAYCTSLRPIELKAIGALSQVRHFVEGERIYSAGDEAEEFFIINRGVVELSAGRRSGIPEIVLSRGDLFGAAGPLRGQPRDHSAQARAQLSVQCFRRSDFPELLRKVPSFFLFLCERLATRLFQTSELVRSQAPALELTGSLANFDVVTIYQTILHSKQTGLLTIANNEGEKISEFFFASGTPRWGRFEHLTGEEAFWQLFLHDDQAATFSFANGPERKSPGKESALKHQADELLISAIHMRDEFDDVRKRLPNDAAKVRRKEVNLLWDNAALADLRRVAEAIWQHIYNQPAKLGELCRANNFCDLKIYKAVEEMVRNGLVTIENSVALAKMEAS